MLKIRVMPTLLFKELGLVKGIGFHSWRRTGSALQTVRVYNMREVDEIVFLDITATPRGTPPDFEQIDELADECFMPMTVGGGIRNVEDIRQLLAVGADKVSINTAAVNGPEIIREAASQFGSQCVVVSIDFTQVSSERWVVCSHCGRQKTELDPVEWAKQVETLGAGEILLTSVERDGTMEGYDVELTRRVTEAVSIPVIASGGAGNYQHMAEVLRDGKASAVAAASIYHFTHQTPKEAKLYLKEQGFPMRL